VNAIENADREDDWSLDLSEIRDRGKDVHDARVKGANRVCVAGAFMRRACARQWAASEPGA
jgi:hypothetical protein